MFKGKTALSLESCVVSFTFLVTVQHAFLSLKQPTVPIYTTCLSFPFSSTPHLSLSLSIAHNSSRCISPSLPSMNLTTGGSDLTYNNPQQKRRRECSLLFLDGDISSHLLQQSQDVDRLILYHAEKVRMELMERRRRYWNQALAAVEESLSKRLKAKDDEIERIGNVNWLLEEKIRGLSAENHIWRELAKANEAAAADLRSNLEQVLAGKADVTEDAESCCEGDNCDEEQPTPDAAGSCAKWVCRNCGEGDAAVLLLPCRHLCLCGGCAPWVNACPVCRCGKDGSVHVNML